ncbi:hypothetical protein ACOBQJ_10215 [Pelotomaculum propionicicum]|uniref:hypothetical protein n=1 Tax=Pelotomaculum propionicicum TaxID=258475 RepID=UPI003B7B1390
MKKKLIMLVFTLIFVFSFSAAAFATDCCDGCCCHYTLTPGFWKNHTDLTESLLPIALGNIDVTSIDQAVQILNSNGDSSNGINKLCRNLLAVKLNFAYFGGSLDAADQADAFLMEYGPDDWSSLTKEQKSYVLGLASALDDYNNSNPPPES